jgi:hypothetical protein
MLELILNWEDYSWQYAVSAVMLVCVGVVLLIKWLIKK